MSLLLACSDGMTVGDGIGLSGGMIGIAAVVWALVWGITR